MDIMKKIGIFNFRVTGRVDLSVHPDGQTDALEISALTRTDGHKDGHG